MTPAQAKSLLPIIQAFAEGKTIQCRFAEDGPWMDMQPMDGHVSFTMEVPRYRIKPEPQWRAWTAEECPAVMVVAQIGKVFSADYLVCCRMSKPGNGEDVVLIRSWERTNPHEYLTFGELFRQYVRVLPTGETVPCGERVS